MDSPVKPPPPIDPVKPPPPLFATGTGQWFTSLFGCFSDIPICCLTNWCPCVTFGRNVEILDKGTSSCAASAAVFAVLYLFTGMSCIYSFMYRAKLRYEYGLPARPCDDCLVHFFCQGCALCQEYRELKYRGLDPKLGWHGNLRRHAEGVVMPVMRPVVPEDMKR